MTEIGKNTVARVHYTGTLPDSGEVLIPVKTESLLHS